MKLKPKYTKWEQISINTFLQFDKINKSKELDETEKEFEIYSIIYDTPKETFYNMTLGELKGIRKETVFINAIPTQKDIKKIKDITIGDIKYNVITKLDDFTVAQYVDFQEYIKMDKSYMPNILATFLIPKGKKYNEDYDLDETVKNIGDNLNISLANSLMFFFTSKCRSSINNILISLELAVKTNKKMKETKELMNKRMEIIENLENLRIILGLY